MSKMQLTPEDIEVMKLDDENKKHINNFSCKACIELEKFLKEDAWKEHKSDFSKTYLFFHKENLAGYATILADKQSFSQSSSPSDQLNRFNEKNLKYKSVPALKIGRLCTADSYNSQLVESKFKGLGTIMFASILNHAIELSKKIGCRLLTTHAKKKTNAYIWYKKNGFFFSHNEKRIKNMFASEKQEAIPMFYDIKRIIN